MQLTESNLTIQEIEWLNYYRQLCPCLRRGAVLGVRDLIGESHRTPEDRALCGELSRQQSGFFLFQGA